ncbi:hypothetical protein C3B44_00515 [Corynebacterium yudongzhengii]|uniref:Uncharacterized protein n=1 Tax=Corynebacterium yudongzhengii TaxID=2080740 RepID=A0A2U1T5I8_9CORY|nr:hypothetical protein [Corynebacterium yudongzhengii]AWB81016.1 hypothetical protein C3B44_00515 [Corynebacterium yudongzhengii]PWC01261.1 hypothetical protein DF222_08175 [Corynebacterium yudongzhengii]
MRAVTASRYQLKPRRTFSYIAIIVAFFTVLMGVPWALMLAIPQAQTEREPVVLSSASHDIEIPVTVGGEQLRCASNFEAMLMFGYDCGDVLVESIIHDQVADRERTLRRMMSASSAGFVEADGEVINVGGTLVLFDDLTHRIGILTEIDGGRTMYAQVQDVGASDRFLPITDGVWRALHDEPLPAELAAAVEELGAGSLSESLSESWEFL